MERDKRRILPKALIGILILFLSIGVGGSGQASWSSDPQELTELKNVENNAARFQVQSDLVLVPVTVTTGHGRVVPGLAKEDFSVFEDHVAQTITHFTSEDAPATIGLVVDTSDSMAPRMAKAKEAVFAVLRNANPSDEFFLIRFSSRAELLAGRTSDTGEIRRATDSLIPSGSTALLDAVKIALKEMSNARHSRKAIILISDGEDNASQVSTTEFQRLVTENDTIIYCLFVGESSQIQYPSGRLNGAPLLEAVARQTGGRMFTISKLKQLPEITARIGSWIRSQYVLGYVPAGQGRNSGYHRIQVKISKPSGFPKLNTFWRRGYTAPG